MKELQISGMVLALFVVCAAQGAESFREAMFKGGEAVQERKYQEAGLQYRQAVSLARDDAERQKAWMAVAESSSSAGDYAGAVNAWRDAAALLPDSPGASQARLRAGITLLRNLKQYENALAMLLPLCGAGNSPAVFYAVEAAIKLDDLTRAQEILDQATAQKAPSPSFRYDLILSAAALNIARKEYAAAAAEYEKIAELKGFDRVDQMNYYLYNLYFDQLKDPVKGRAYLDKAVAAKTAWVAAAAKKRMEILEKQGK